MASPRPDFSILSCRVCLQTCSGQEMSSIFDLDADLDNIFIYEKMEQCAGIEVLRDENVPTFICGNCHGLLKVAYEFRITCRNSEEILKKSLMTNKVNSPRERSAEQNPLSIKENNNKKRTRSKNKKGVKIESDPISDIVKEELIIPPDSPANFEEPIADNFNDDNGDMSFDIDYYNDDDENDLPSDESTKVSVEKINFDVEIPQNKVRKRKKTAIKRQKSTKLRSKILTLHKNDNEDEITEKADLIKKDKKEKRSHICEICGNKFPFRYSLKNHIKRHFNEKSFNCDICGYSSHSNMELVRHLRTHTGLKPYKCQYCNRAFGDHSTLTKHERVHRNERPFKCDICGSSFSYPAVLKRHKLVHTGEKPYKCEICGKCFNDRYHLQSHLKTIQHKNDPRVETLLQNIRENNV